MAMFELKVGLKNKSILNYFRELPIRTHKYLNYFNALVAQEMKEQLVQKYGEINDDKAEEIIKNLKFGFLKHKRKPRLNKTLKRNLKRKVDISSTVVFMEQPKMDASMINIDNTLIKIRPNRRGFKQSPTEVILLDRYGPWHYDMLPWIPTEEQGTITFVEVKPEKALAVKKKNKRNLNKLRVSFNKIGTKFHTKKYIQKNISGYEDMQFWALKKEFGIDGRKKAIWKPTIDFIRKRGVDRIINKNRLLHRVLFDPQFKQFLSIDRTFEIFDNEIASNVNEFQNKIR